MAILAKSQLVKILKHPIPSQTKIGKNKGGLSTFFFPEIKKLASQTNPKITIKISSILISIILPPVIVPPKKLGEKEIAVAKKNKGKFLRNFFLIVRKWDLSPISYFPPDS